MPHSETSRRDFLGAMAAAAVPAPQNRRPNIVVIMADDMGFSDLGCYGAEIRTPNLDALAKRGIRFTQFYNNAKCCPTRASLLTGLYNHQAGVGNMVDDLGTPAYQGYLNDRCVTIAEALRPAGYRTLMSGKWHVGEKQPHWPLDRGFDRYFGLISGSSSYFQVTDQRPLVDDRKVLKPPPGSFYMTDLFTDKAIDFVDSYARKPDPFFLYVAYNAPHWPLHALPEDIERYRGKYKKGWDALRRERHARMIEMGIVEKRWPLTPRDSEAPAWEDVQDKEAQDLLMAVYAAQIDRMDQGIGRILAKLKETGAEDDTLVLFLADNGGCSVPVDRGTKGVPPGPIDSFLSYGLPWANASNTPFRQYKSWVHEGGIATPLIAAWPRAIKQQGALTHQHGHIIDMMATCLDVAGAKYPARALPLEGRSLLPVLKGGTRQPHAQICWEHLGNRAIRQGKYKLVSRHREKWELYDLEADRTELRDLASTEPRRAETMGQAWQAWADRCGVQPWDKVRANRRQKGA